MNISQGFACFASALLEGQEGIFFSFREGEKERWVFGIGKKISADFSTGPFPFFSLTSFLGDKKSFWHFPEWYSDEECGKLLEKNFPQVLQNYDFSWPLDLTACSNETEKSFCSQIKSVQSASEQGDIWVLNLAHELSEELSDEKLLLSLYHSFLELKKNHCGGVVWTVEQKMCSMSPEVFLTQKGNILSTFPIKGTGDREYLEQNEKEISELAMVTDLLRNDLGQIAKKVWVENERVLVDRKSHWDAHSEIYARLPQNNISWEQFEMLLPAGSISGAPKKRVVEKILELENFDRDFYTGTFGVRFSPEESIFNILIRTLFAQDGKWRFPVGAGITYESDAVAEWQETLQKAEILRECTRT